MTKWIAVLLAALLLAGCGGGDERADGAVAFAGQMRATGVVMATQSAPTAVTADMTLDWAEYNFPDLFPKATGIRFPAVVYEGVTYNARLYAGAWGERYLGITPDGRIFGLGDFTGEALQQFNDIDHWAAQVLADQCNVNPDSCVNLPPVANAGPLQNVTTGTLVTLDGSASSDANGDQLTYSWSLTSKPAGSAAALASATSAKPTFTADLAGTYVASLTVNDGTVNSAAATVTVTASAANAAPVANAGTAQNVLVGGVVTLNGSASSDANGDPLTYAWTLSSKPAGSTTTLAGATTATPTFTPDIAGSYVAGLTVNDGQVNSARVTVTITATPLPPPIANFFLFGGPGNSVYLGCLTCDRFHAASVCNQFGTYGSQFSASSIWSQFGTYGSQFSSSSPWNQFSTSGPIITGSDTLFYGYFTTNAFQFNRTTVPAFVNVLNFFSSTRDLAATRTYACGS